VVLLICKKESVRIFWDNIDRIGASNYEPTYQDILYSRVRTSGIVEINFTMHDLIGRIIDVGGQRTERRKWLHCFEDITSVIFCVAASEYNLTLLEDNSVNRMKESLVLFDEVCNSTHLRSHPVIFFLNKIDLFTEKIKTIDLKICFDDYDGGLNFDLATKFIENKFRYYYGIYF